MIPNFWAESTDNSHWMWQYNRSNNPPPFIIYAAKQLNPSWIQDEVGGSQYAVSDKGWIDQELSYLWLRDHFLENAVSRRPLLLLLAF